MSEEELMVTPLSPKLLEQAAALCGECVGENLYTKTMLAAAMEQPGEQFFLLITPKQKAVAYIYATVLELEEAEQLAKHSLQEFKDITQKNRPVIGNLQSIGVLPAYRNQQLSRRLMEIYLQWLLEKSNADIAFGVFWKPNGNVPMEKTLRRFGFSYLTDARRVWYDRRDLICPICKGRCECDAAIYYKQLERDEMR